MNIALNPRDIKDYERFLKLKDLAEFSVKGNSITTTQQSYDTLFGKSTTKSLTVDHPTAYDYQLHFANLALKQKRYGLLMGCGLGKTLVQLLWLQSVSYNLGKTLLLCPLSVMQEFINDAKKFNIDVPITNLRTNNNWTEGIGILNYESRREIDLTGVKAIALDESSIIKNSHGKTKRWLVDMSKKVEYVLASSATPSPNYRSEYSSLSTFLKYTKSDKEFLAMFFRQGIKKKGEADWMLKSHAVEAFYKFLSSFCCYVHNPKELGFQQGGYLEEEPIYNLMECGGMEHIFKGQLFATSLTPKQSNEIFNSRNNKSSERFKSCMELATNGKPTITWCLRDNEEKAFYEELKDQGHVLINGKTPIEKRVELIQAFRDGEANGIISKLKVLAWGVNLQRADQHILSGYNFSFEQIYQGIRRSHRNGRTGRLTVNIPMTEPEKILWAKTQKKLKTFEYDVSRLQDMFVR